MIPQQKDKKNKLIYIYLFFLILISSINNKNFYNKNFFSENLVFEIKGLSNSNNQKLTKHLTNTNKDIIFRLDKQELSKKINENNLVLNFLAQKNYPNKINISIKKATYVGKIYKNDMLSLIGSNGKIINRDVKKMTGLPYFYGNFEKEEFLEFLDIINKVGLDIKDISSFYFFPSGRWDIKFKDGLLLKLPDNDLINILSKTILLKNDQNFRNSKILDLRIQNRVISNEW